MPLDAKRLIRKMRGGAQAHLLQASDDHCYVVKFLNNPQHRRILVNEWIATTFLEYLGIASPKAGMVRISEEFLARNPDVYIQLGNQRCDVLPGWHFGSRYPGDPARTVVYDYLPDGILDRVENYSDFLGILAFDKWMGNVDSRQAIFFRGRVKEWVGNSAASPLRLGFVAQMMDNGFVFEGPQWRLTDAPLYGLYFRPMVYKAVRGLQDFEPWLERIRQFPEEVVDQAVKQIPEEWLAGDREALEKLLDQLLRRRKRVADLVEDCRLARRELFPNW